INWYGYFLNAYTSTHYALYQNGVDTNAFSQIATNFAIAYHKLLMAYNADTGHFLAGYYNMNDYKIYVINTFPKIYTDSLKIIFGYTNPPVDNVAKVIYACNTITIKEFMKRFKATTEINGWDRQKRFINIAANKSMLYYATRNKSIYETYSISSICTNGISYRIIGKRNNRYKTFFVTPNQISRIGNNYISLTVCDNDVYPTMSDAELSDGSNCPVLSIYPYKFKSNARACVYDNLNKRELSSEEETMLDQFILQMKESAASFISIKEFVFTPGVIST
ncbi:MAG TPA: hypothetical protein PK736_09590, partial [Bacteroidia bacterium]|nr:hypothetical protein [Bacteroidia bacterium]